MSRNKKKVFVAMSGGVDSSVATFLLKEKGYEVTGIFMRCFNIDGCAKQDAEDARMVAEHLGIPFYTFDFEEEYKKEVVDYMIKGYRRGITPNPDVMCNKRIKFGCFLEKALSLGADCIATGHYVRIHENKLFEASDKNKDQSYFLWTLTQEQLKNCLFPIGDFLKSEVRKIAKEAGLPTAEKKDSQGICFLGKVSLGKFLKDHIPSQRGNIVNFGGEKVGEHEGAQFFTIGQRRMGELATPKIKSAEQKPRYIAGKDIKTNTIVVVEGDDNPALYSREIYLEDFNFINPDFPKSLKKSSQDVFVRIRYRQPLVHSVMSLEMQGTYKIVFGEPVKSVASGQSAVFYSKEGEMIGGGVII